MDPIAEFFARVTVGELFFAFLLTTLLYEAAIVALPDRLAGPGGWLIDTSNRE